MIRRSAKELARNELRARQIWMMFAHSGFSPSSGDGSYGNVDRRRRFSCSSLGHLCGREDSHPAEGSGIVKSKIPDAHVIPPGLEDVSHYSRRRERITEQSGITGRRDHKWLIGSTKTSPVVEYHGAHGSSSQSCSSKLGRSPDQSSALPEYWNRCGAMRMLSTNSRDGDGYSRSSSDREETHTKEDAPARPKSIDDFQHEEIVGPTVERDESDTANQLRESLGQLTTCMTTLRNGFLFLGSVQLLALLWSSAFHGIGFFVGLSQDFSLVMSFVFAYLLRVFGPRIEFFSKIEGRSRMKILTLSLQAIRMLNLFFFRSTFVVKAVALCSGLALLVDVWHSQFK